MAASLVRAFPILSKIKLGALVAPPLDEQTKKEAEQSGGMNQKVVQGLQWFQGPVNKATPHNSATPDAS